MSDQADKLRAELPTLAAQIARELGSGWSVDTPNEWNVRLIGPNREHLPMHVPWNSKGQVRISGSYPIGITTLYGVSLPGIGVSASRGAKAIAKEITRRLLPEYAPVLVEILRRHHERELSQFRQRDVAASIAARFPALRWSREGFDFHLYDMDGVSLSLNVREGGSISIKRLYGSADRIMPMLVALLGDALNGADR